jgi:hypothetical protein
MIINSLNILEQRMKVLSNKINITIGIWAVRQVKQIIKTHKIAARFGFYINLFGFLVLLEDEITKGEVFLSAFIIDPTERIKIFKKTYLQKPEEVEIFSDLCYKFQDFLLSSENNVPPQKASKEDWAKSQITLVKFFQKGKGMGKISYFSSKKEHEDNKVDFDKEILLVKNAITVLKSSVISELPEIQ